METPDPQKAREAVARYYRSHHDRENKLGMSVSEKKRGEFFADWIGQGKDVLDVGCRDGTLTRNFAEGNRVTGMDIDEKALELCKESLGIATRWCDFSSVFPFESETFDAVVAGEVIEHLPYPKITVEEISRVLRPGGLFVGSVPNAYHMGNRLRVLKGKLIDYDPTHLQMFHIDKLKQLLHPWFEIEEMTNTKGKFSFLSLGLFRRDLVWKCRKKN